MDIIKKIIRNIILVVLAILLLSLWAGCGIENHFKPRASKNAVEKDLERKYAEEFVVISKETLPNTKYRSRTTAYQAYPEDNPELIFHAIQSISPPSSGDVFGSSSFSISDKYTVALTKLDIEKWLEESKWEYTTEYSSLYADSTNEELTEKYFSSIYIYISIEQEDKEILCEQLAEVLNTLLEDEAIKKWGFRGASVYLLYEENGVTYEEAVILFDTEFDTEDGLIITKEMLSEKFLTRKWEV